MRTRIPGVMRAVQATAWAIVPEKLHAMLDMLELRAAGVEKTDAEIAAVMSARSRDGSFSPSAGSKIAVLPLYGVVCQRAGMMTEYSGGTSTEQFAASFDAAMANADVGAIVIDCDSPGGSVSGVPELAARVFSARGKGKRIIAVANSLMASAAYWVCASADEIVAAPSALIGSIGVFTCHTDESGADEQAGLKRTLISAGKYKTEGNSYEPLSAEALAAEQAMVDEYYGMFVAAVAKGRGVKAKDVENGYGQGRCLPARQAASAGLVDRIATLEQVLAELGAPGAGATGRARSAAAETPRLAAVAAAGNPITVTLSAITEAEREIVAMGLRSLVAAGKRRAADPMDDDEEDETDDEDEEDLEQENEDFVGEDDGDPVEADDDEEDPADAKRKATRRAKGSNGKKGARQSRGLPGAFTVTTGGAAGTETTSPAANRPTVARGSTMDNSPTATELVAQERKRAKEIRALCAEHHIDAKKADEIVDSGVTVEAAAVTILQEKRAAAAASPVIRMGADREAEKPFASFGEQLQSIVKSTRSPGAVDKRLLHIQQLQAAASGMGESTPSDGGFAIQTDFAQEILKRSYQTGQILSRVRTIPISENANGLKINAVDETSRATGSRYGGIQSYWANEADTVTAKKPKLRQMQLELRKLFAIWYLTDELIQDSTAMGALANDAFSEEVTFMTEDAIMNGPGNGQPLGIYTSNAVVQVAKEAGQATGTVNLQNVTKMYGRLWTRSLLNAVWLINQDVFQQLLTMTLGNFPVYMPPTGGAAAAPYGTLLGRPIVPIEYAASLSTAGDITLCDLSQYLAIDKGGPQQAQSLHVRFLNDEMTFRITYRVDGQPIWNLPVTPKNGTNTVSPFITLQSR